MTGFSDTEIVLAGIFAVVGFFVIALARMVRQLHDIEKGLWEHDKQSKQSKQSTWEQ